MKDIGVDRSILIVGILAIVVGTWLFRFDYLGNGASVLDRWTGKICNVPAELGPGFRHDGTC